MSEEQQTESVQVEGGTVEVVNNPVPANDPVQQNPLEVAAHMFTLYFPKLKMWVQKLSNKQLRRVLLAVVEHPLNDKPFHFTTQAERDCFKVALELVKANALMEMVTIANSDQFKHDSEENKEEKKEVENGTEEKV